jgi:hypothetical protein
MGFMRSGLAVGVAAAMAAAVAFTWWERGLEPASWVAGVLASSTVMMSVLAWAFKRPAGVQGQEETERRRKLDGAAIRLAEGVRQQWVDEVELRGLAAEDRLVPVWMTPVDHLATAPGDATRRAPERVDSVAAAVAAFERIPSRQCVILGRPGSGKTSAAVLLTLGLARGWLRLPEGRRNPAEPLAAVPVPVFMSLAGWDPNAVGFLAWMETQLRNEHPYLGNRERYGPDAVRLLLENGRVCPILDGLDEIAVLDASGALDHEASSERRAEAIRQLAAQCRSWHRLRPQDPVGLVLTCRADEYQDALERSRQVIKDARVLQLQSVELEAGIAFIGEHAHPLQREKWEPVLRALRDRPTSPLAQELASPLAVTLASEIYSDPRRDPAELLPFQAPGMREELREHLLDGLVDHAFPGWPGDDRRGRWAGDRPRAWLEFLARQMAARGEQDLKWWELPRFARPGTAIVAGLLGALILLVCVGMGFGVLFGVPVGIAMGALNAIPMGIVSGRTTPPPAILNIRFGGRVRAAALAGSMVALVSGLAVFVGSGSPESGGTAAIVFGLPVGLLYGMSAPADIKRAVTPLALLQLDRTVALVYAAVYGLASGLFGGLLAGPVFGALFAVACALAGGLVYGPVWLLTFRQKTGLVAWLNLNIARVVCASRGQLPWRLLTFLEEAHRRGVLRRAGAVYQFRHVFLRDALAREPDVRRSRRQRP